MRRFVLISFEHDIKKTLQNLIKREVDQYFLTETVSYTMKVYGKAPGV